MKAIIIFILLFCPAVFADSIELIGGGLTYHTFIDSDTSSKFSNKIGSGALIYNSLFGFKYTKSDDFFYDSYSFFMGHNSINEQIGGFLYSFGLELDHLDLGISAGGYYQDSSKYAESGMGLLVGDFMPIFGVEVNYKIMISDKKFIKINNLLTPLLTNHTLSIGEYF